MAEQRKCLRSRHCSREQTLDQYYAAKDALFTVCRPQEGEDLLSIDDLKSLKLKVRISYEDFKEAVRNRDRVLSLDAGTEERRSLEAEFAHEKQCFEARIQSINQLRQLAGDIVSEITSISYPNYDKKYSLKIPSQPSIKKCEQFVENHQSHFKSQSSDASHSIENLVLNTSTPFIGEK